ncbi:MAG TPA: hypothetical protein PK622_03505 [Saprospiraceae bacterium]|nr:hypothetical protein [Saprospiraceae bacterium]HUN15845.1 hypothetical protein [Saprospiraceae bacterium]
MKNLKFIYILCIILIFNLSMQSQVTSGFGGSGNVGGFGRGVSIGSRTNVPFSPGSVNNPSGKLGPTGGDDRNVYWVHGLKGDIDSWLNPAEASEYNVSPGFPARKLKSISDITYGDGSGLLPAGNQLEDEMFRNPSNDRTKDFTIAHSQGGMVSRGLLHNTLCLIPRKKPEELPMGGLVTFCSPHQGAQLLNGKALFHVLAGEMCDALLAGPTAEFSSNIGVNFKIFGFSTDKIPIGQKYISKYTELAVDQACKTFENNIIPFITDAQTPRITQDYEVGSKILTDMNACLDGNVVLTKFPKVAFFGVEPKQHLMLRTVKYFLESCQSYDYFDANEDETLIHLFQKNYENYFAKYEMWRNRYENKKDLYNLALCDFYLNKFTPLCIALRAQRNAARKNMEGYLKGVKFLETMDDKYKIIIGALRYDQIIKLYCICEGASEFSKVEISTPSDCPIKKRGQNELMLCRDIEELTVNRVEFDSDGVVLASSASNLPGATFGPQLMDNTSHMQARNNAALKGGLTKLYSGGTDPFFYTPVK